MKFRSRLFCTERISTMHFMIFINVDRQIAMERYITLSIYGSVGLRTHSFHFTSSNHGLHIYYIMLLPRQNVSKMLASHVTGLCILWINNAFVLKYPHYCPCFYKWFLYISISNFLNLIKLEPAIPSLYLYQTQLSF